MTSLPDALTCDVCEAEPAVGVAAVPGVPMSMAYGRKCLDANAHPRFILVANTAQIGGLEHAAEWWKKMVEDTIVHLNLDRDEFDKDVAEAIKEFDEFMAEQGDPK